MHLRELHQLLSLAELLLPRADQLVLHAAVRELDDVGATGLVREVLHRGRLGRAFAVPTLEEVHAPLQDGRVEVALRAALRDDLLLELEEALVLLLVATERDHEGLEVQVGHRFTRLLELRRRACAVRSGVREGLRRGVLGRVLLGRLFRRRQAEDDAHVHDVRLRSFTGIVRTEDLDEVLVLRVVGAESHLQRVPVLVDQLVPLVGHVHATNLRRLVLEVGVLGTVVRENSTLNKEAVVILYFEVNSFTASARDDRFNNTPSESFT